MKAVWQSKTLWANVLTAGAALLAAPEVTALLGPDAVRTVVVIQAAMNIILRMVTSQPIRVPRIGKGGET